MKLFTTQHSVAASKRMRIIRILLSVGLVCSSAGIIAFSYFTASDITNFALRGTSFFAQETSQLFRDQATEVAIDRITSQARSKAINAEALMGKAMAVATTLAETLEGMKRANLTHDMDRDTISKLLRAILMRNPELSGIFTCWEPNAFDGKDSAFANSLGHDASGRFLVFWNRTKNQHMELDTLQHYNDKTEARAGLRRGEFYLAVKETKSAHFIPLYPYPINGKEFWFSSFVAPVVVDTKFLGVVGVNLRVNFMQNLVAALKNNLYEGNAEVTLITHTGIIAASTLSDLSPGMHMSDMGTNWRNDFVAITKGKPFTRLQQNHLVISTPFTLSSGDPPGSVFVSIPENTIVNEAKRVERTIMGEVATLNKSLGKHRDRLMWQQIGVGSALALVTLLTLLLIRRLSKQGTALRESEARLREILHNTSTVVFVKDLGGKYLYVNPSYEVLLNKPSMDLLGKTDFDLFPAHIALQFQKNDHATIEANKSLQWEEEAHGIEGTTTFITTKFPLHDTTGLPYGLCGIALDITERKNAVQKLREVERELADVIDSMPSMLVAINNDGIITHWNNKAEEIFGHSRKEAVGQPFIAILPDFMDQWPRIERAISTAEVQQEERKTFYVKHERRVADIMIFPLLRDEGSRAVMRIDDITSQTRIEEIMIQTEKMMSVGGLAAGMAHEINNPLGAVLQGAQNIERRISLEIPANVQKAKELGCDLEILRRYLEERKIITMLQGIKDSGVRAARIVQNMLNFSRKSESRRSTHNLEEVVSRAIELAQSDYDLKKQYDIKQTIFVRKHDDNLIGVNCINTEIEQVLLNLIKNASQAMAEHETPEPCITIRTRQEFAWAVIDVEDNGPGMTEDVRKRIFEPFYTTKPPGLGTGLGLSVSYFIVTQNHGGTFTVDSYPGRGTTFTIRLPIEGFFPDSGV